MSAPDMVVFHRKRRRSHLVIVSSYSYTEHTVVTMCHRTLPAIDATATLIPLNGGATARLRNDLMRELGSNTCAHCTLVALGMLTMYVSRDTGRPW